MCGMGRSQLTTGLKPSIPDHMGPRFGFVTRALAVVFVWAGLGSGCAGLSNGNQTTPGTGDIPFILIALAAAFLVVGASLWLELLWAWWAGVAMTGFVVVMAVVLKATDAGWFLSTAFFVAFAISAIQGWQDRSRTANTD
jgi:hypothetical protein